MRDTLAYRRKKISAKRAVVEKAIPRAETKVRERKKSKNPRLPNFDSILEAFKKKIALPIAPTIYKSPTTVGEKKLPKKDEFTYRVVAK